MIKAKIIADSQSTVTGDRLTTLEVVMPRYILAEFNTHRMLSKNSASSRAIPFKKMVKSVQDNPFIPMAWQKDHKGMQGTEYFTDIEDITYLNDMWLIAKDYAVDQAEALNGPRGCIDGVGVTKQMCNRLLEPFMYHTVLVSATEWENFFSLRCPQYEIAGLVYRSKNDVYKHYVPTSQGEKSGVLDRDDFNWLCRNKGQADIHIMAVAEAIWDAMKESAPSQLNPGEWHIPFGDNIASLELERFCNKNGIDLPENYKVRIATARCARLSYQTLGEDPKIDYEADLKLHDMLIQSGHFSPTEHCAKVMNFQEYEEYIGNSNGESYEEGWCRNFRGFIQYRELID